MDKIIGIKPNQAPSNADLGTIAYQDAEYLSVENLKVGSGNIGNTPSAWVTIVKDNDNSGNQLVLADSEGQSPAIRTYSIPGTGGDPAGLILNHYYAQSGSGNQYMRYADFVSNVGSGAGTSMRFITKNSSNTYTTGLRIDQDGRLFIGSGQAASNFGVYIQGKGAGSNDARALHVKGFSNHTTIGATGPTIVLANGDGTTNNITKLSFETSSNGEAVSINCINTNHSSFYGDMAFNTRGAVSGYSEKLRIKADGKVGIGTSSPAANLDVIDPVSGNFDGKIHIGGNGSNRRLILEQTDVLTYTIGGTGTNTVTRFVSAGSAGTGTEAMRIDSSGNLLLGKLTSNFDASGIEIRGTGELIVTRANDLLHLNRISSDGTLVTFRRGSSSTVGSISVATTGTTYNTTSDRKLKENIELISDGKEKLMLMKASTFNFIADKEKQKMHGFVAQEMKEIIPEAVTGDDILNMDYGRITPILVAALQDAFREIEELRNKLENK